MNKTIKKILKELCPPFSHAKIGDKHFIHVYCVIGDEFDEYNFEFDKHCMASFLDAYEKAIIWDHENGKRIFVGKEVDINHPTIKIYRDAGYRIIKSKKSSESCDRTYRLLVEVSKGKEE